MSKRKPQRRHGRGIPTKRPEGPGPQARRTAPDAELWLYGAHAVLEALANPRRRCRRVLLSPEAAEKYGFRVREILSARPAPGAGQDPQPETVERDEIGAVLSEGAVHQGLALLTEPLPQPSILDLLPVPGDPANAAGRPVVVVLDQVTDPQNLGAVLRSAAAFGARAVVATRRHAPAESGALAKTASGALEHVPYIQETNLSRSLDALKRAGFWCLGLSGEAKQALAAADPGGPLALILGAEGAGLRRLTREACDVLARLPTRPPIDALNVSNAAAIALYELLGRNTGQNP